MRRGFLLGGVVLCCLLGAVESVQAMGRAPQVRNILFIGVDDLKPTMGCYGDAMAKSPRMDRLAEQGTVFLNAHCQQAVCGPSRASLMTGLRPDHGRVWDLKTKIRTAKPDVVTLPQYLRSVGFETAGVGKIFDPRSVDKQLDALSWSIPYSDPNKLDYPVAPGKPVLGAYHSSKARALYDEALAKGVTSYKEQKKLLVANDCWQAVEGEDVPDDAYTDGRIAAEGIRLLEQLKETGKPFFLAVGFKKPHLPFVAPKKYWDLYEREAFELHPFQQKSTNGVDMAYHGSPELVSYGGVQKFDSFSADAADHMPADKQRELMHGYYACVSYIDAQVGRLMDALEENGLSENTAIVLWGDHGFHLGDHGLWCKHSNFEQATRSPLLVITPWIKGGKKSMAPVEFVDLFPTVCELGAVPAAEGLDGTSLVSLLRNPQERVKEVAVSQWHTKPKGGMGYALRDERYRYVEWIKSGRSTDVYDPELVIGRELYDYENDPRETINVADHPEYREVAALMNQRMREFFESQQ